MNKHLFNQIKAHIPESIQPALLGKPIAENIPHSDWNAASKYLEHNYGGRWTPISCRKLNASERKIIQSVKIVPNQFGYSACFFMKDGGDFFIPMAADDVCVEGKILNKSKLHVMTLWREGEHPISRITLIPHPELSEEPNVHKVQKWIAKKQKIWNKYLAPLRNAQYKREGIDVNSIFFNLKLY